MGLEEKFWRVNADIKERGFAQVQYDVSRADLVHAAEAFIHFLGAHESLKRTLSLPRAVEGDVDLGYIRRTKDENRYEPKEFFHYAPVIDTLAKDIDDFRVRNFLKHARFVYTHAQGLLEELLDCVSARQPGLKEKFIQDGESKSYLRFLCYPEGEGMAAKGHYDKGAFTLALAESSPGLHIEDTPANNCENCAIIMPGITSTEVAPGLRWDKSWHYAVYDGKPYRQGVGRWAIVFFSNDLNQRLIPPEETHTRVPRKDF